MSQQLVLVKHAENYNQGRITMEARALVFRIRKMYFKFLQQKIKEKAWQISNTHGILKAKLSKVKSEQRILRKWMVEIGLGWVVS